MKLREIRVSGETDDEYTKGAKVGGTTTTNTTNTTNEGSTIAAHQTRRIQQLEAALIEAEAAAGQVCVLTLFKIIHLIPLTVHWVPFATSILFSQKITLLINNNANKVQLQRVPHTTSKTV